MSWFKSEATTWREKAAAVAARLADTEAAIGRLRGEATGLALDAAPGNGAAEKRVGDIEREIATLSARQGWQQQALAEAEAKAAADDAAAEAERQRQAAEARRRRGAELSQEYAEKAARVAAAARAFIAALDEAAAAGNALGEAVGTDGARRLLEPHAIANRYRHTLWRLLHGWFPYTANEAHPEMKMDLVERERALVAGLLDGDKKPIALLSSADDGEPEAA